MIIHGFGPCEFSANSDCTNLSSPDLRPSRGFILTCKNRNAGPLYMKIAQVTDRSATAFVPNGPVLHQILAKILAYYNFSGRQTAQMFGSLLSC